MSDFRIDKITNRDGSAGTQIAGISTFSGTSGMIIPNGPTEYRGGRGRGVIGGQGWTANIEGLRYIEIATTGNAIDFGDMAVGRNGGAGAASATRGVFAGGYDPAPPSPYSAGDQTSIEYTVISSKGGASSFGDLQLKNSGLKGCSDNIRALWMGGKWGGAFSGDSEIEYSTIATTGDSSTFGYLRSGKEYAENPGCFASTTRGVVGAGFNTGGGSPWAGYQNSIDYVTIQTLGNSQEFGNLTQARGRCAGLASPTRGVFLGGNSAPAEITDTIDYITIATLGNAADFGNLTANRKLMNSVSSHTRGVVAGGTAPSDVNIIEYITIATTGNSVDFGDMPNVGSNGVSCSDCHGGIL